MSCFVVVVVVVVVHHRYIHTEARMLSFSFLSSKVWYGLLCVRGGIYRGAMFKFTLLIPANYPEGGCPVSVQKYPDFQLEKLSREREETKG